MKKIIIDIYGGDHGPVEIVKGALCALNTYKELSVVLVGDETLIKNEMANLGADETRVEIINTDKFITNNDNPACVFKGADDTSVVMALETLKKRDDIVGMLSAGSTGAIMVGSMCRVGLIQGLASPVLATVLPCKDPLVCLVDCGGIVECSPDDLKRFALLGNIYMQCLTGNPSPKIGLMSVGREDSKGNNVTKAAFKLIKELPLNFIGNLEGSDLVDSEADVVVTDGFTGNVLLKNTEHAGKTALAIVEKLGGCSEEIQKIKTELYKKFEFNSRGGATFLGARKTIVKMHGTAVGDTVGSCIDLILSLEERNFNERIATALI